MSDADTLKLQDSTAITIARDHIDAWSHHNWDKTRELLAPDIHAVVTTTDPKRTSADFTGIDNYMERKVKAAQLIEPGSTHVISTIGDESNALVLVTMRIGLGPGGAMVSLARAILILLDENKKIKEERDEYFMWDTNTKKPDYRTAIVTNVTPKEAFDKVARVSEWWATNFEGSSQKLNDIFTVRFGNGDMYKLKVSEFIPDKTIAWQVIDSNQTWVANVTEWTGTTILWEVSAQENGTRIDMTHTGLGPSLDCYDKCIQGWDYLLHKSLIGLLTENKGLPA